MVAETYGGRDLLLLFLPRGGRWSSFSYLKWAMHARLCGVSALLPAACTVSPGGRVVLGGVQSLEQLWTPTTATAPVLTSHTNSGALASFFLSPVNQTGRI
jgi:hypothetical protein